MRVGRSTPQGMSGVGNRRTRADVQPARATHALRRHSPQGLGTLAAPCRAETASRVMRWTTCDKVGATPVTREGRGRAGGCGCVEEICEAVHRHHHHHHRRTPYNVHPTSLTSTTHQGRDVTRTTQRCFTVHYAIGPCRVRVSAHRPHAPPRTRATTHTRAISTLNTDNW
jgi:hypothetical protein